MYVVRDFLCRRENQNGIIEEGGLEKWVDNVEKEGGLAESRANAQNNLHVRCRKGNPIEAVITTALHGFARVKYANFITS